MNYSEILKKSFIKREPFFASADDTVFRLFNLEADGVAGLTIDYYDGIILVQNYSERQLEAALLTAVSDSLLALNLPVRSFLLKDRSRLKEDDDIAEKRKSVLIEGEMPPDEVIVKHMGLSVSVDPVNAQNTGLFMDMRNVRRRLLEYYPQCKSVLNLFCYTSVFSVHALKNGSSRSVNVDISAPVLNRGKRNFELNGLAVDGRDFIKERSDRMVKYYRKKGIRFDLAIIDPPTFARSRNGKFSAEKDYRAYLEDLVGVATYVMSSTNTFTLSEKEYRAMHPSQYKNIFMEHEADDFPSSGNHYLKAGLWKIGS